MSDPDPIYIMSAEWLGNATTHDGILDIGGVKVPIGDWGEPICVFVRRSSKDLSIIEISLARHDGLAQEELAERNRQAAIYPLGPKEYWRGEMVGKFLTGEDQHPVTDEEFERDWED